MTRGELVKWWGLGGYLVALFGILPFAPSWWRGALGNTVGRFITIEELHVVQYAGLGWLLAFVEARPEKRRKMRSPWRWFGVSVGLLDEVVQGWLPQRVFQWSDVFLNWGGVLLGALMFDVVAFLKRGRANQGGMKGETDDV